jgi:alpha-L-arabinofuranosidase
MAPFDPNRPHKIINRKSGKALSAAGTGNGSPVILFEFVNGLDQLWFIVDAGNGNGPFKFENRHSGRLLSTLNGGSDNGTIIHVWEDLQTFQDQHWAIEPAEAGFVKIANAVGGRVVSCRDGGTANNTTIHLWDYLGGYPDQDWSIEPVPAYDPRKSYRIVNRKSGTDLSVSNAGSANGSHAILFRPVDAEDQRWHIVDLGNGFQKLVNNHSGRVLSTVNGESTNGTVIHIWDELATFHDQQWAIRPIGDDFVKITNRLCGRVVSCLDGGVHDNTTIHLWDDLGGYPDQEWRLEAVTEHVDVDASYTIANVSPYMTGVCLEDVNHEVYGGIDSQMIFGESFQELRPYDPSALYKIISIIDGKDGPALSVRRRGLDNGSLAIVWEFVGAPDQFWRVVDIGDGFYKLINHHNGKALSTLDGGSTNGTPIHLWDDLTTFRDQHWAICPSGLFVRIMNRTSRRVVTCMDAKKGKPPGAPANNTRLQLFDFPSAPGQDWSIKAVTSSAQPDVSGMWRSLSKGSATGSYALGADGAVTGWRTQRITFAGGSGEIGIENRSLNRWGMDIQAGNPYEGYLHLRASAPTTVYVAFESASGESVYAETSFTAEGAVWARYDYTLTPSHDTPHGRFAIKLKEPGSIDVSYAFVQPGAWGRFKGLPVRKDIAEGLLAQGVTFMRFGGSSVGDGSEVRDLRYRWKNMRRPRDKRPFTEGFFYPYGTNGWGIFDFLDLAEAMRVVGIPAVSINESREDMADFVDYVNGPMSTTWGRKRAEDGHPEPYRLRYLELGNEETIDDNYVGKFENLAQAIWGKDPDITLIVAGSKHLEDITNAELERYGRIVNLARQLDREVWVDCHVWTDDVDLGQPQEQRHDAKVLKQVAALDSLYEKFSPGARFKLVVFELNANSHDVHRALANAIAIGAMQRLGDKIRMVASANALQADDQNDNAWDQGLLFFNPRHTWAQPPYYVTQMKARHYLPRVVHAKVSGRESVTFDVTAMRSDDGTTLDLHVVNTIAVPRTYTFHLHGFDPHLSYAQVTTLSGAPGARSSASNPHAVAPSEADVFYERFGNSITLTFAPSSFTIVRLR